MFLNESWSGSESFAHRQQGNFLIFHQEKRSIGSLTLFARGGIVFSCWLSIVWDYALEKDWESKLGILMGISIVCIFAMAKVEKIDMTLPQLTLSVMRRFWATHRHPRLLFPSPAGGELMGKPVNKSMDASGIQGAFRATMAECGIKKKLSIRSLRHAYATHLLGMGMDMRLIQDQM